MRDVILCGVINYYADSGCPSRVRQLRMRGRRLVIWHPVTTTPVCWPLSVLDAPCWPSMSSFCFVSAITARYAADLSEYFAQLLALLGSEHNDLNSVSRNRREVNDGQWCDCKLATYEFLLCRGADWKEILGVWI